MDVAIRAVRLAGRHRARAGGGRLAEQAAFMRRERILVLVGVDKLVALVGSQAAHAADRPVDGLAAVGRQLLELLKELGALAASD